MTTGNDDIKGGVAAAAICSQKRPTPDAHRAITRGANECWHRFVIRQKNEVEKMERERDELREAIPLLRDLAVYFGDSCVHPLAVRVREFLSANGGGGEVLRLRDGAGHQRFEFKFDAWPQPDSSPHDARHCKVPITATVTAETRRYAEHLLKAALGPCSEPGHHYEFKLLSVSGTAVD